MFIEKRDTRRTERDSCDLGKYGCKGFSKMLREVETRGGSTFKTKGELVLKREREQARKEERGRDSDNITTYPLLHFLPPTKIPILFQRKN